MKRIELDKTLLQKLYIEQNLSHAQMVEQLGVSKNTIRRKLVEFNIEKTKEQKSAAISNAKKEFNFSKEFLIQEYLTQDKSVHKIAEEQNCSAMTICNALKQQNITKSTSKLDRDWLYNEYVVKRKSRAKIAEELNIDEWTVRVNVEEYSLTKPNLTEEELLDRKREYQKNSHHRNKDERNERTKKQRENPAERLKHNISNLIYMAIKNNKSGYRWEVIVGYTLKDLQDHLQKKFKEGMNWKNMGRNGWHIDHIIPIKFKLPNGDFYWDQEELQDINSDTFKKCWALDNLQPLWEYENIAKGNRSEG